MILVTAATAPVGRSIVEQLVAEGEPVRALTRNPDTAGLPEAAEVVAGDLGDPDSLAIAFRDVRSVFLLAAVPGFAPAFLKAAKAAGVRRIVFQSTGAIDDNAESQPNDIAAFHWDIEQAIRDSGLEWTFLRLAIESADALQWAFDLPGQVATGDVVKAPYADARVTPIHPADFAAVAIAALTDDSHAGKVYEITGPEAMTHREQVALLGRAMGRSLTFEELTPEEARKAAGPYAPVDVLFETWSRYTREDPPVTDTVERVTGKPARSRGEWAGDVAQRL
jgi:uncharacterized protein YbjT (DUF2867 family)